MKPKDQKNDLRFWLAVPVVLIVLCVGLTLFHRCTELGESLSVDDLAMVGTTLFAAAIGFLAVVFQVRSASRQLREQMADQHKASAEESERQKRAVAAALLAEIDDFYEFLLKGLWEKRNSICGAIELLMKPPPELGPLPSTTLVIYRSIAHQLGTLSVATVKSIVSLYNFIANFGETYETYRRAWSPSSPPADPELATKLRDIFDLVPTLVLGSYRACEQLAKERAAPLRNPGLALRRSARPMKRAKQ